jgi:hypothetical protein
LEQLLLSFFVGIHDPSTRDLLSPSQAAVAAALFEFIHRWPRTGYVQVGTLSNLANEILDAAGERIDMNPRKCSNVLASLGFGYRERSSRGSLRCLDNETIAKIHKLKRDHGDQWHVLSALEVQMSACAFCDDKLSSMPTKQKR